MVGKSLGSKLLRAVPFAIAAAAMTTASAPASATAVSVNLLIISFEIQVCEQVSETTTVCDAFEI